jgi:hypothetical protein
MAQPPIIRDVTVLGSACPVRIIALLKIIIHCVIELAITGDLSALILREGTTNNVLYGLPPPVS